MDKIELKKLAELARISVSEGELSELQKDMEAILHYVSKIQEVASETELGRVTKEGVAVLANVMREDGEPHESGIHTEALLSGVPETEDGYVKVKKIISI